MDDNGSMVLKKVDIPITVQRCLEQLNNNGKSVSHGQLDQEVLKIVDSLDSGELDGKRKKREQNSKELPYLINDDILRRS